MPKKKQKKNRRRIELDATNDEIIQLVREHSWRERRRRKSGEPLSYKLCLCKKNSVESDYYQTQSLEHFKSFLSKTRLPDEIMLDHDAGENQECADWLIKVCDCLKQWLPNVYTQDEEINKKLDKYGKRQKRIQKRRRKPYFK
jgi:hypothetical protein